MIVVVSVKTSSREDSIIYDQDSEMYIISVKVRPIEGEANEAIIRLLSKSLHIPKSQITLKSGQKSKIKRFEF